AVASCTRAVCSGPRPPSSLRPQQESLMNIHKAQTLPEGVREILCTTTLGGFWDAALIVASKSPLFVRLYNDHESNVIGTLSATIDDKDEGGEHNFRLESKARYLVQLDTTASGTCRWRLNASTSDWDELQIAFLVTG